MARRCTVCRHPEREAIDQALLNNGPLRTIADQFKVSKTTLIRHKKDHIPELLAKGREAQKEVAAMALAQAADELEEKEVNSADSLFIQLKEWINRTEAIFLAVEKKRDYKTALKAVREGRDNLEFMAKLLGKITDGTVINIYNNPQWIELRAIILKALEPYPEAKEALVNALP